MTTTTPRKHPSVPTGEKLDWLRARRDETAAEASALAGPANAAREAWWSAVHDIAETFRAGSYPAESDFTDAVAKGDAGLPLSRAHNEAVARALRAEARYNAATARYTKAQRGW